MCLLNLKAQLHKFTFTQCYKSFFHVFMGSRIIAPEENCSQPQTNRKPNPNSNLGAIVQLPPTLKLALTLNQPPTPTGAQFSSGGNSLSQTLILTGSNFPRGQLSGYRFHILNCCKIDLTSNLKGRQTLGRYLKVRSNLPEKQ